MSNYTEELHKEIERVTLKGNADKETMRKLASIIFRLDLRIQDLEKEVASNKKSSTAPNKETVVTEEPVEKKQTKQTPEASK